MSSLVNDKLTYVQMCTIRSALRLEILGMRRSRSPSAYVIAKRKYGFTGNRKHVFEQLEELIKQEKAKLDERYSNVQFIRSN